MSQKGLSLALIRVIWLSSNDSPPLKTKESQAEVRIPHSKRDTVDRRPAQQRREGQGFSGIA